MASTKRNGFHWKEWLPLTGMASTKRNVQGGGGGSIKSKCYPLNGLSDEDLTH